MYVYGNRAVSLKNITWMYITPSKTSIRIIYQSGQTADLLVTPDASREVFFDLIEKIKQNA